jgi:hypothetical protein
VKSSVSAAMSAVMGRACSVSRRLAQAGACEGVGAAKGIGHPVPAGHVPDEVGGVGTPSVNGLPGRSAANPQPNAEYGGWSAGWSVVVRRPDLPLMRAFRSAASSTAPICG